MLNNWLGIAQLIIVNLLPVGGVRGLFGAHPATEKHIMRLMALV